MAVINFFDAVILVGDYDLTGDSNQIKVSQKVDMLERTVFGNTEHRFKAGLRALDADGSGFAAFDDSVSPKEVDYQLNALKGVNNKPFTIAAASSDGATAMLGRGVLESYALTLMPSDLGKFDIKFKADDKHTRGKLILPLASRVASGAGTIYQLGALAATESLLACLHVTEFNGTSLDVSIYSNDTNDTVTPTSRIAFTQATGRTSEYKSVAGAITDTYWYASFTFVGTSFSAAVSAGVR